MVNNMRIALMLIFAFMFFISTFLFVMEGERCKQMQIRYQDSIRQYKDTIYWLRQQNDMLIDYSINKIK